MIRSRQQIRKERVIKMERTEARDYFKKTGLTYERLTKSDINVLYDLLSEELFTYLATGGFHAQQMSMRVSKLRIKDIKVLKSGLKYAQIQIDGRYFSRREGITFSSTGFIGFGCEFSDINVQPILKAFIKWCDHMATKSVVA